MTIASILEHKTSSGGDAAVATIGPDDTVTALIAGLAEHRCGALVVVRDGDVVGIASERDVVRRLADDGASVLEAEVSAIMTTDVRTCSSDDEVDEIAGVMTERRIRHMPVVDDGSLVGIVSIGDVVLSHIRQLEHDRGQLEQYISS